MGDLEFRVEGECYVVVLNFWVFFREGVVGVVIEGEGRFLEEEGRVVGFGR